MLRDNLVFQKALFRLAVHELTAQRALAEAGQQQRETRETTQAMFFEKYASKSLPDATGTRASNSPLTSTDVERKKAFFCIRRRRFARRFGLA